MTLGNDRGGQFPTVESSCHGRGCLGGGGEAAGGGGGGTGRTWPHMGPGTPGVGDSNVPRLIAPLVNTGKAVDSAFRPIGR